MAFSGKAAMMSVSTAIKATLPPIFSEIESFQFKTQQPMTAGFYACYQ
jgi:hypothetical protein